jgi:hypothetical protein
MSGNALVLVAIWVIGREGKGCGDVRHGMVWHGVDSGERCSIAGMVSFYGTRLWNGGGKEDGIEWGFVRKLCALWNLS